MTELEDPRHYRHREALRLERELEAERRRQHARAGWTIVIGAVLVLVGLAITLITHAAAADGGGRYVFAYGPIIGGVILAVRGLVAQSS
jgi:hypothetical protein